MATRRKFCCPAVRNTAGRIREKTEKARERERERERKHEPLPNPDHTELSLLRLLDQSAANLHLSQVH